MKAMPKIDRDEFKIAERSGRRTCIKCKEEKDFIYARTDNSKCRIFVDKDGNAWASRTCHACELIRAKANPKKPKVRDYGFGIY